MQHDEPSFAQQWVRENEERYRQELDRIESALLSYLRGEGEWRENGDCELRINGPAERLSPGNRPYYEAVTRLESQGLVVRREEGGCTYWRLAIPGFDKPVA